VNKKRFEQLRSEGFNRIPVYRSVLADLDTPLSVYLKLAEGTDSYLLESVEGGETWGRYSIIGLPCRRRYTVRGHRFIVSDHGH
jgi:anthranilate synthase component 1